MEIIDLKKYLTPNEIEKQSNVITVSLYSDQIIERSGFYNTIFKRNVGQLRKRVFTISKTENVSIT
ncbi:MULTISPECIES: hypothetical protein [unclassified Lactobacillus]|uniref:hypothetical protein n=1 Tax=unclassified Lactobacillus TaxID=2620435 RepID=UPI000EFD159E|nr:MULTISPECIES: hypothetical protein [unclassified Lactobacillus]RMC23649.1 hypothetical protein F5ESL0247_06740 [Lactobacillus sp. ESL0247]RMC27410.1 hypothetical protein F5ESL0246_06740 [Lactobacillus sp. ESL0246]RMC30610.1 hypothetical protein F5ESL0245_06740 [Lactobacillus sp. ESL0245]RMC47650.1 hypothetical protein F5ESL0228_06935 [Lactobacillus sp. ESL0228]